jgi:hypothetical protein
MKTIIITIFLCTSLVGYFMFKKQFYTLLFNLLLNTIDLFDKRSSIGKVSANLLDKILEIYPEIDFGIEIIDFEYLKDHRCVNIRIKNTNKLPYHKLLPTLYFKLQCNEMFQQFASFKVIISTAQTPASYYSMHDNFLITPNTTILDFYYHYLENLLELTRKSYNLDNIEFINMKVWNMDDQRNKHIKFNSDKLQVIDDEVNELNFQSNNILPIVLTNSKILNNKHYAGLNNINDEQI